MTNNELRKNVTSAMKSFELEGFVYTEEEFLIKLLMENYL